MSETSGDNASGLSPDRRRELNRLIETYSIRTRQLSEAIHILGGNVAADRDIAESIAKIRKLSRLVDEARLDLFTFFEPPPKKQSDEIG